MSDRENSSGTGAESGEGKDALIIGIRSEARGEAQKIISEAKQQAKQQVDSAEKKAKTMLDEAGLKAEAQAEEMRKSILSGLQVEIKRRTMRIREAAVRRIIDSARDELKSLMEKPEYRKVLLGWIVEAGVGLGNDSAVVNTSPAERGLIDGGLLREAEMKIEKMTGRPVKLAVHDGPPLSAQGVELTSEDGRTAFNNQVSTRILRNEARIRALIHKELFGE